ncbi:hypothetical protein EXIGLDRAFT_732335 [Exidia glandulosa HHB12029]|uniref:Uncharacterized protein n=1 Tax=Exidia glandulosa HHB12029 TaxID=1314781 RepID=A0A165KRY7_EXIGL|nr:hypothetical protein EXIGLDRAFT_732335 [Exidia glandulosa HHB12029]
MSLTVPERWSTLSNALQRLRQNGVIYLIDRSGPIAPPSSLDDDSPEVRNVLAAWTDFLYLHSLNMALFAYDELGLDDQTKHGVLNTHRLSLEFTAIAPGSNPNDPDAGVNPAKTFKVSRLKVVPLDQARHMGPLGQATEFAFEAEVAAGRDAADAHFRTTRHAEEPGRYVGCIAVLATVYATVPLVPGPLMRTKLLYLDVSGPFANAAHKQPKAEAARVFGYAVQYGWMMDREDRKDYGTALRRAEKQTDEPWELHALEPDEYNALYGKLSETWETILGTVVIILVVGSVLFMGRAIWTRVLLWRARKTL